MLILDYAGVCQFPLLTRIHLIQEDYPPAKLIDHPGYGSQEELVPTK